MICLGVVIVEVVIEVSFCSNLDGFSMGSQWACARIVLELVRPLGLCGLGLIC